MSARYAKAMGFKVIGLDINDDMLSIVKHNGADAVFNTRSNPTFAKEVKQLAQGKRGNHGVDAVAVYSDASPAYETAQQVLKINGTLMCIGLPKKPLEFAAFPVVTNAFNIRGSNTGTPKEAKKAVDFTIEHGIIPEVEFRKLEEVPQMYAEMEAGKAKRRMAVVF